MLAYLRKEEIFRLKKAKKRYNSMAEEISSFQTYS